MKGAGSAASLACRPVDVELSRERRRGRPKSGYAVGVKEERKLRFRGGFATWVLERRREGSEERVTDGRPTEGASKGQPAGGQPGGDGRAEPYANIAFPVIQRRSQRHGRRSASSDGSRLLF